MAEGNTQEHIVDRWAVVIGVSKYKDPSLNLEFADRDAREFYEFLRSPEGGSFKTENIALLINEVATVASVNDAFRDFLKKPGRDDLVIIYLACHGSPDPDVPGNVYLLAHDVVKVTGGVPFLEIDHAVQSMKAERVVIFADACHSAAIGGGLGNRGVRDAALNIHANVSRLAQSKPGVALLTSCEADQVAREGKASGGGHGVFTYFLLEGLRGEADTHPKDGAVTVGGLFEYVRDKVKVATDHRQHPSIQGRFDRSLPISTPGVARSRLLASQGAAKLDAGDIDAAESHWRTACELDPDNAVAIAGLAKVDAIRAKKQTAAPDEASSQQDAEHELAPPVTDSRRAASGAEESVKTGIDSGLRKPDDGRSAQSDNTAKSPTPHRTFGSGVSLPVWSIALAVVSVAVATVLLVIYSQPPENAFAVTITVEPSDAVVEIDGSIYSPGLQLNPGDYSLRVFKEGYEPWEGELSVQDHEINRSIELSPKHYKFSLHVEPQGALWEATFLDREMEYEYGMELRGGREKSDSRVSGRTAQQ